MEQIERRLCGSVVPTNEVTKSIVEQIVNDRSVQCKRYITEMLCAICISRNMGHKILLASRHDLVEQGKLWKMGCKMYMTKMLF
jgi:hypothetical protein